MVSRSAAFSKRNSNKEQFQKDCWLVIDKCYSLDMSSRVCWTMRRAVFLWVFVSIPQQSRIKAQLHGELVSSQLAFSFVQRKWRLWGAALVFIFFKFSFANSSRSKFIYSIAICELLHNLRRRPRSIHYYRKGFSLPFSSSIGFPSV